MGAISVAARIAHSVLAFDEMAKAAAFASAYGLRKRLVSATHPRYLASSGG